MFAGSDMTTPLCTICKTRFLKMEYLDKHMEVKHGESDSIRIERLTQMFQSSLSEKLSEKSEPNLKSLDCSQCGEIFNTLKDQENHSLNHHGIGDNEVEEGQHKLSIKSEHYEIREYPENTTTENKELDKVFGKKTKIDQQDITLKGKNQAFKDASTAIKSKLKKGKILKDNKGRQVTILDELPDGAYKVEVQTLSKKANQKPGQVKLHLYRPEPSRKKVCTILISKFGGFDIVFVKVLMEMFMKPMIDLIFNYPGRDPVKDFIEKPHEKTIGKDIVSIKEESDEVNASCKICDKVCLNDKGLRIHMGKVHSAKRKRVEEKCIEGEQCETCGYTCDTVIALKWHTKKCTDDRNKFHEARRLTPANKKAMRREVMSTNNIEEAPVINIMEVEDKNKCDMCDYKNCDEYALKQHQRDDHRTVSVSVTPPPKKKRDNEINLEVDSENIVKQIDNLQVAEEKKVLDDASGKKLSEKEEVYFIEQEN